MQSYPHLLVFSETRGAVACDLRARSTSSEGLLFFLLLVLFQSDSYHLRAETYPPFLKKDEIPLFIARVTFRLRVLSRCLGLPSFSRFTSPWPFPHFASLSHDDFFFCLQEIVWPSREYQTRAFLLRGLFFSVTVRLVDAKFSFLHPLLCRGSLPGLP